MLALTITTIIFFCLFFFILKEILEVWDAITFIEHRQNCIQYNITNKYKDLKSKILSEKNNE